MPHRFSCLALVLGLGVIPVAAQPTSSPNLGVGPRQGYLMGRMADTLKLTSDQKTRIQAIQARYADTAKAKTQAAVDAGKAFREAARNPDTPLAQLKSLHQVKSDKDFERMLERRALRNEIRAILTPEQRTQWDAWQAYRQGMKHGRRMGRRGMGF